MTAVLQATDLGKKYRHKWALSDCTLSIPQGHVVGLVGVGVGRCPNRIPVSIGSHWHTIPSTQGALQRCIDSFHLRQVITYQPANHYWPLQWIEAAIFVGGAVALIALSLWWVRKRIA